MAIVGASRQALAAPLGGSVGTLEGVTPEHAPTSSATAARSEAPAPAGEGTVRMDPGMQDSLWFVTPCPDRRCVPSPVARAALANVSRSSNDRERRLIS